MPGLVDTQSKGSANNLAGSFLLNLNPKGLHSRKYTTESSSRIILPGPGETKHNYSSDSTTLVVKYCETGKHKLHHIPARLTGSGIEVFSHDTLLPITDSAPFKKRERRGGRGRATYLSSFCLKKKKKKPTQNPSLNYFSFFSTFHESNSINQLRLHPESVYTYFSYSF